METINQRRILIEKGFSLEHLDLNILHTLSDIKNTIIDFGKCNFLPPTHIVNILFLISYLSSQGDQVTIYKPEFSSDLDMFLQHIGFYNIVEIFKCDVIGLNPFQYENKYKKYNYETKYSIQYIDNKQSIHFYKETQSIISNVFRKSPEFLYDKINIPFYELISNIIYHSNSFGFSSFFKNRDGIEIVIGDIGIGLFKSLSKFHDQMIDRWNIDFKGNWDEKRALEIAFSPGVTTSEQKIYEQRGMGLYYVMELIKDTEGTLICRSGRTKMICKTDFHHFHTFFKNKLSFFPGVQYEIFLPIRNMYQKYQ